MTKYDSDICIAYFQHVTKLVLMYICLARLLQAESSSLESIAFAADCYHNAMGVLDTVKNSFGPLGSLKYAPDHMLIGITYCATILFKVSDGSKIVTDSSLLGRPSRRYSKKRRSCS